MNMYIVCIFSQHGSRRTSRAVGFGKFFFGNLCKAILFFFRNNSLSESARCGNCYYTMTVFY